MPLRVPMDYGACVYLHVQLKSGIWKSSLVLSWAKVAPIKRLSLPRLELMGALLCARLMVYVHQALKLPADVPYHCRTDSTVTLAWVLSDPHKWKPFVANRVSEIQKITDPCRWRHCTGRENPADLVTRGVSARELVQSNLWLTGPAFLLGGLSWVSLSQIPVIICREELDTSTTTALVTKSVDGCLEPSRWSTLGKAMRFHAAREQLMKLFGPDGPVWRFIAPSAPWWGGWWELLCIGQHW